MQVMVMPGVIRFAEASRCMTTAKRIGSKTIVAPRGSPDFFVFMFSVTVVLSDRQGAGGDHQKTAMVCAFSQQCSDIPSVNRRGPAIEIRRKIRALRAYDFAMRAFMLLFVLSLHPSATAAEEINVLPPRDASWRLVWAEEFDRDGPPDPKRWEFEHGFERNHELQWYQPENAFCRDGVLIFEARRQRVENPDYQTNHRSWKKSRPYAGYTSASIITREHLSWKYGRFEIRARFPALPGLWPAIWTTGRHGHWPHNGEIDIMEYYKGLILANTVHAGTGGRDLWHTSKHPIGKFNPETWDDQFHLWVMEWDEDEIAIHLDGRLLTRIDLSKTFNLDGPSINPFRAPHRLRLNLAIGSNGGDPSKTRFPQRYEVDYVRIYQKR